jgi:hypothetical protein
VGTVEGGKAEEEREGCWKCKEREEECLEHVVGEEEGGAAMTGPALEGFVGERKGFVEGKGEEEGGREVEMIVGTP